MNNSVLAGKLKFLSLSDLLQLFGASGSSGILTLKNRYASDSGQVFFDRGNPINASSGSLKGLDAIYSFFGWTEGEFEFSQETVDSQKLINQSRMEIILNALRMLDEGKIDRVGPGYFEKKLPAASHKGPTVIKGPLVDYMSVVDEEEFFDGEKIIEEGKHGSWMWVILEGAVNIVKETSHGSAPILRIGEGSFIGNLASFLLRGNIRSISAVAAGNVQLGVLDSQRLCREYATMSRQFRDFIISLDKRYNHITTMAAEIKTQKKLPECQIDSGQPVIRQGESESKLLTITDGSAFVVRSTDRGYIPLATLDKGDFIGFVPFLKMGHEPYSASVFGSEDLKVEKMELNNLQNEYEQLSVTFKNIIENVATCVSVTTMNACDHQNK
jgi:CRP-like cAMP-binding protein